ncbi:hypothetical protein GYH30_050741 [Glycine max]|uniref:Uncharacterized protein n=1 Tax=Glycine max TaxID=3847 RepID=A0A0R0F2Q5_SOYBN|nr:hypothetical protein GYH30_050741 [Glycine max]
MASRRGGVSLPDRPSNNSSSVLAKISRSSIVTRGKEVADDAAFVAKKLLRSTGKAAMRFSYHMRMCSTMTVLLLEYLKRKFRT